MPSHRIVCKISVAIVTIVSEKNRSQVVKKQLRVNPTSIFLQRAALNGQNNSKTKVNEMRSYFGILKPSVVRHVCAVSACAYVLWYLFSAICGGCNAGSSIWKHMGEKYGDAGSEKEKAKMEHRSPQYELE